MTESDDVQDRLVDLIDEGGMVDYVRSFRDADPATWDDDTWDALRAQLWKDCYDGERYAWQPLVPMIQSIYERQRK